MRSVRAQRPPPRRLPHLCAPALQLRVRRCSAGSELSLLPADPEPGLPVGPRGGQAGSRGQMGSRAGNKGLPGPPLQKRPPPHVGSPAAASLESGAGRPCQRPNCSGYRTAVLSEPRSLESTSPAICFRQPGSSGLRAGKAEVASEDEGVECALKQK